MWRAKWLRLGCTVPFGAIAKRISSGQFAEDSGHGFELVYRDSRRVKAKFVERISLVETVTDPYGQVQEFRTIRYDTTLFQIHACQCKDFKCALEVVSPPRSVRALIEALDSSLGGIHVGEFDLQLLDLFRQLAVDNPSSRISRIKASRLRLSPESEAKVDFSSLNDAYVDFIKIFGISKVDLDKVKIDRPFGAKSHCLEIGRSGLVAVDDEFEDETREFVLSYLKSTYASALQ